MAVYHQSDVSAWARCAAQVGYKRAGLPDKTNSAAAFGSVMHHALQVLERELASGTTFEVALQKALETFTYYWHPLNIEAICEPVPQDGWLPRQGYSELRQRGLETIRKYADLIRYDQGELLATEYPFIVPLPGTWDAELGEPHYLAGSIDRLAAGFWRRFPILKIEDYKCPTLDTRVLLADGREVRAGELLLGDVLVGRDGDNLVPVRVTAADRNPPRPCVTVVTASGRQVTVTADHPFLTARGWVKASDLDSADAIHLSLGWEGAVAPSLGPGEAYALGAMVGDGGCTGTRRRFTNMDAGVLARMKVELEALGIVLRQANYEHNYELVGLRHTIPSAPTAWVRRHGLEGASSYTKRVPPAVMAGGPATWQAFLAGYFDTDGHISKRRPLPHFEWTSVSVELLRDVQTLLAGLGIKAWLFTTVAAYRGGPYTSYRLAVRDRYGVIRLARLLSPEGYKADPVRNVAALDAGEAPANYGLDRVRKIEPAGEQVTVRLSVSGPHTYTTAGLTSHNTGKEYTHLRYNLQFSGYALASLQREFWVGCRGEAGFGERGEDLFARFASAGRRGTWINLRSLKFQDAGWRGPVDYARFTLAVEQMHASITADIFPLSISGENCRYCPYRSMCGGTGLPDEEHGKPQVAA